MVGPSLTDAKRRTGMSRLQAFVILLVAASGALVALYADAPPVWVGAGGLGGAVAGVILWWYMVWAYRDGTSERERGENDTEKRERFK